MQCYLYFFSIIIVGMNMYVNIEISGNLKKYLENLIRMGYAKNEKEAVKLILDKATKEKNDVMEISLRSSVLAMPDYFKDKREDEKWKQYL